MSSKNPSASVQLLRDFIAIPSVNPMDRSDIPDSVAGETRYAEAVHAELVSLGLDASLIGEGNRKSVIAEANVSGATDTVLIASHLDTVPVDGMVIDPFDPQIEGNHLLGRGSCDTKGGMASLLVALRGALEQGTLRRNVIVVGEADEELGSLGVDDVLEALGPRRPDWVLATEPTELRIVHQHKGIALARVVADGVACHGSDPSAGRNAIGLLARAILVFENLAGELGARVHPVLGSPTLSAGVAGGGHAPNIVPDHAWLILDRRMIPGETVDSVRAELEGALEAAGLEDVRVDWCRSEKGPLGTPEDHPCIHHCRSALEGIGHPAELGSVAFGTDAGALASHGFPGVVMGPGSIERAHTSREYVELDQVDAMTAFFRQLLESGN